MSDVDSYILSAKPPEFWRNVEHQRRFWDLLAPFLGFSSSDLTKWYSWSLSGISKKVSDRLDWIIRYHKGHLATALQAAYPGHSFKPWLFASVPVNYWEDRSTHRLYFDWLRETLKIPKSELHLFYDVSLDTVYQNRGRSLVRTYYGSSLATALTRVYPEHKWEVWKFSRSRVPRNFWLDPAGQRQYFEALTQEFAANKNSNSNEKLGGVSQVRGEENLGENLKIWYEWSAKKLEKVRPESACVVRAYYGGNLPAALKSIFPEHRWDETQFKHSSKQFREV